MSVFSGRDQTTDNLKSIGLILRAIDNALPFDEVDKTAILDFVKLPDDALEMTHSYNSCTIS